MFVLNKSSKSFESAPLATRHYVVGLMHNHLTHSKWKVEHAHPAYQAACKVEYQLLNRSNLLLTDVLATKCCNVLSIFSEVGEIVLWFIAGNEATGRHYSTFKFRHYYFSPRPYIRRSGCGALMCTRFVYCR